MVPVFAKTSMFLHALRSKEINPRKHRGTQRNTDKNLCASRCPQW